MNNELITMNELIIMNYKLIQKRVFKFKIESTTLNISR